MTSWPVAGGLAVVFIASLASLIRATSYLGRPTTPPPRPVRFFRPGQRDPWEDVLVTHQAVLDGLPSDVRDALTNPLPPSQRGWWTAAEIEGQPGEWIEVTTLGSAESQYIPGRRP